MNRAFRSTDTADNAGLIAGRNESRVYGHQAPAGVPVLPGASMLRELKDQEAPYQPGGTTPVLLRNPVFRNTIVRGTILSRPVSNVVESAATAGNR